LTPRRILSIDGGGIRGAMIAAFIASIERKTQKSFVENFDLLVGTSTGGIIGLGLAAGFSGAELLEFYKSLGPNVFGKPTWLGKVGLRSKFETGPLRDALVKKFGEKRLGESITRLVIPAYDNSKSTVYVFKTAHHQRLATDYKEKMVDIAISTAAAPSYFQNHEIEAGRFLVDGGVWANNPSVYAAIEARSLLNWDGDIKMLSLSCGSNLVKFLTNPGKLRVLISFIPKMQSPIVELLMRAQSEASSGGAALLLGHTREAPKFFRIESESVGKIELDDVGEIDKLIEEGEGLADRHLNMVDDNFLFAPADTFRPFHLLEESGNSPDRSNRVSNIDVKH